MSKSQIEWTDEVWNPVTGCSKVSQGCKNCYAEREWLRMTKLVPAYAGRAFTDVRCHPERLETPLHWKRPRRIFVNSMSDLFHEDVPREIIWSVFDIMERCPQHTFQILTKRPERMLRETINACNTLCVGWLENVWIGVSVEDQATADERIPLLLKTPAAVRWISAEPLLGPIDLAPAYLPCPNSQGVLMDPETGAYECCRECDHTGIGAEMGIDWVVVGGESGPNARPMHPAWARDLRHQCSVAGVPFLFKQWGEWASASDIPKDTALPYGYWAWISNAGDDLVYGFTQSKINSATHQLMARVGKKRAGRLLDGALHDDYPDQRSAL